jgi:hypothetical protein
MAKSKRNSISVVLTICLVLSMLIQTQLLNEYGLSLKIFLTFTFFILSVYIFLLLYLYLFWQGDLFDPIFLFSTFYLITYYYSTMFLFSNKQLMKNHVFDYGSNSELFTPILIVAFSFILFMTGVFLIAKIFPVPFKIYGYSSRFRFNNTISIGVITLLLIIVKIWFLSNGWAGSLTTFSRNLDASYSGNSFFIGPVKALFSFSPILVAYLSAVYYKYGKIKYLLVFVMILEILISFVAGDRRDIITLLLPVFFMRYHYTGRFITGRQFIYLGAFGYVFLFISTIYSNVLGSFSISQGVDYFELASFALTNYFKNLQFDSTMVFDTILVGFNKLYLVDSAIRANISSSVSIQVSPIFDFLTRLIPFSSSLGFSTTFGEVEFVLFKASLISAGDVPYLTNPLAAESFLVGGWSSLLFNSFFSGCLLYTMYRLSFIGKYYQLWYAGFFVTMSSGFIMSLGGETVIAIKIFILVFLFNQAQKFIMLSLPVENKFRVKCQNISLS